MRASLLLCAVGALLATHPAVGELRDPTRPAHVKAIARDHGALRVEAVFTAEDRSTAIVNGRLVRVGDEVNGARIDAIFSDGVRYSRDGRSSVARLNRHTMDVRRPAREESP